MRKSNPTIGTEEGDKKSFPGGEKIYIHRRKGGESAFLHPGE